MKNLRENQVCPVILFFTGFVLSTAGYDFPFITFDFFDLVLHGNQFPGIKTFLIPKDSFYYRPVLVFLLTFLHRHAGLNYHVYHLVFSLLHGTLGSVMYLALHRLFGNMLSGRVLFFSCLITLFLSPLLWEAWYFSDSEPIGAVFLYLCVHLFLMLRAGAKRKFFFSLMFILASFLAIFSKETTRVSFVLVFFLMMAREKNFSNARLLGIPLLFLFLTFFLPKFFHGLEPSPKPASFPLDVFLILHTVFQMIHPFGVSAVILLFMTALYRIYPEKRHLLFLSCTALIFYCIFFFPAGTFFQYFETVTFPTTMKVFIPVLCAMFLLSCGIFLRHGTDVQTLCAQILLLYLLVVIGSILFFPYARMDSSSRNFISVFPFFSVLWMSAVVSFYKGAGLKEKFLSVFLIFFTFLHFAGEDLNLFSRMKAQSSVEWSATKFLASLNMKNAVIVVPDNLFPILPDNLQIVRGGGLGNAKFLVSSALHDVKLFQSILSANPAKRIIVYYSRAKPIANVPNSLDFYTQGYDPRDHKIFSQVRMAHPSPPPLERMLNIKGKALFHSEARFVEVPRFFEDFFMRMKYKESFLKHLMFTAKIYAVK